jgi:tetratricopeptide (TPR) repeat protein
LTKPPLNAFDPLDRPYLRLAALYAQAGRIDLARTMLSEFESAVEPRIRGPAKAAHARARREIALAEGRHEAAIEPDSVVAVLERYLATPYMFRVISTDHAFLGPALERLGHLYDERGNREKAAENYARFVELWADAEPELQPRVRAARERLDEISAERG